MKLITIFELASRSEKELFATYMEIFNEIAKSEHDTIERDNALASLENVRRVIRSRALRP